jgi:Sulfotransferase family
LTAVPSPPAPASSPARGAPELLYIVGHHKSGATALGAVLAGHPDVFFAGELYRFPSPIWVPGDPTRLCSCGTPVLDCALWSPIRREFEREHRLDELRRGQLRFESWRSLARTVFARGATRQALLRHAETMEAFLEIIARETGSRVITESSLGALRGWIYRLNTPRGLSVKYLHLVRDGRALLWSESQLKDSPEAGGPWVRFPPIVVARWLAGNLFAMVLCSRDPDRYLRVRYEDLVTRPRETLERIGQFAGVDLTEVIARVGAQEPIPMRHIAAGNRNRLQGSIVLKGDFGWTTRLPRSSRVLFWLSSGWLARLYGYRRRSIT